MINQGKSVRVAIHQPNYLPWLGFFHKIRKSDVFILLDDAQFPRNGGNWINRCKINAGGSARWLTVPVSRPSGLQLIGEVQGANPSWRQAHREILDIYYRSAPAYAEMLPVLDTIFRTSGERLLDFNLTVLNMLLELLNPDGKEKLVRSSTLGVTSVGTKRLVELTSRVGGSEYLSGNGAGGYLDPSEFEHANIELSFQNFVELPRPQLGTSEFIPGLSVIDALMMMGVSGVVSLLKSTDPGAK